LTSQASPSFRSMRDSLWGVVTASEEISIPCFQADGVIVSGVSTGQPADGRDVEAVSSAVSIPTLICSGVTPENIGNYWSAAGFIVRSSVKQDGVWANQLDERRVLVIVEAFQRL
jgi:predicted TIM-barrel enzyme